MTWGAIIIDGNLSETVNVASFIKAIHTANKRMTVPPRTLMRKPKYHSLNIHICAHYIILDLHFSWELFRKFPLVTILPDTHQEFPLVIILILVV